MWMIVACWNASIHEAFRQGMSRIFSFAFEAAAAAAVMPGRSVLPACFALLSLGVLIKRKATDREQGEERVFLNVYVRRGAFAFMQGMRNWSNYSKFIAIPSRLCHFA